jgi:lactate permease
MTLPVNIITWVVAALPIIVLLVLMVKFQWGVSKAAPVALVIAGIAALVLFKSPLSLVLLESGKGLWNAFTVLIVIWPAILIYEVTHEAKAFDVFRSGIRNLSPNELLQVLAIGWVFVSFLQGITGFGVPVAVGAPLLVGMGVMPIAAVIIALIGHAWANTFGTLSVAWEALVQQTGLAGTPLFAETALWAAIFIWIFNLATGIAISWLYGRKEGVRVGLPAVLIISLIHGGGQLLLSQINTTIAAFVPACVALGAIFLLGRMPRYRKEWRIEDSKVMDRALIAQEKQESGSSGMGLGQAFFPYFALIFVTLIVLLIPPVKGLFGRVSLGFSFQETATGYGVINQAQTIYSPFKPFIHAGVFLFVSAIAGYIYFRLIGHMPGGSFGKVIKRTARKTLPATIGIVALIIMSKIMSGTGQTAVLAMGTANITGQFFPLLSPAIGILGSFMTSSNLASNILFGQFQQTTSEILNLNQATILAAQTTGGAMGNTICPGNIILATTTTGIPGKEGIILKRILPITLSVALLIGIIVFLVNLL